MGLDLSLLPVDHIFDGGEDGFSHSVIELERRSVLFSAILRLETEPVPTRFDTYLCRDDAYEETHYGNTQQTPYGEPLDCVRAGTLAKLGGHAGVTDNPKNRAVFAYLRELPWETKVALYWS